MGVHDDVPGGKPARKPPARKPARAQSGQFARMPAVPPTSVRPPVLPAQHAPARTDLAASALTARFAQFRSAAEHEAAERQWARTYHLAFTEFPPATIAATQTLFRARPSRLAPAERRAVLQEWVETISDACGMARPQVAWHPSADSTGGGYYRPANHALVMSPNEPSVITLIHETRHAMQHTGTGPPPVSPDIERDARAWSLSLYYQTRPALFEKLVRAGRVLHIDPTVFAVE